MKDKASPRDEPQKNSKIESVQPETARKIYFDATQTIRHYDGERTSTHRLAVAVLGALFAFTNSNLFNEVTLPYVSAAGAIFSLLFLLITSKHSTLIYRERSRAGAARSILSQCGDQTIERIDSKKLESYKKARLSTIRISSLWAAMYITFAVLFFWLTYVFYLTQL